MNFSLAQRKQPASVSGRPEPADIEHGSRPNDTARLHAGCIHRKIQQEPVPALASHPRAQGMDMPPLLCSPG